MTNQPAVVGNWYQEALSDKLFEIVAVDEETDSIQVQFYDGEIEEFDQDTWESLILFTAAPPEDWRGPFEISSEDDSNFDDGIQYPENWSGPLSNMEPDNPANFEEV